MYLTYDVRGVEAAMLSQLDRQRHCRPAYLLCGVVAGVVRCGSRSKACMQCSLRGESVRKSLGHRCGWKWLVRSAGERHYAGNELDAGGNAM